MSIIYLNILLVILQVIKSSKIDQINPLKFGLHKKDECIIKETGEEGVLKLLKFCTKLLESNTNGKTSPHLCISKECEEIVCCPFDRNRLNQICRTYDDIDYYNKLKRINQIKCTIKNTDEIGISCYDKDDDYCCPLKNDTELNQYYYTYTQFTEVIGERCHESKTNTSGVCRYEVQCLNAAKKEYSFCGTDHCSPIRCCPEPTNLEILRESEKNCAKYKRFVYERVKPLTNLIPPNIQDNTKCFLSKRRRLLAGGEIVEEKEYPQMAALGYEPKPKEIKWACGGTLISDRFILTAGHCLNDTELGLVKYVRLGAIDLKDPKYACPEDFLIESRIAHRNFSKLSVYNDIALLKLNRKVIFNIFVLPGCLPHNKEIPKYENLLALGWGQVSALGKTSNILLKVKLTIFNNSECNELYKFNKNRKFQDGVLEETQICAGSRTGIEDTCLGDSGGPLFIEHDEYYKMKTIVAITSFGKACGFAGNPGIYTFVYPYVQWIEDIVWPNSKLRLSKIPNTISSLNVTEDNGVVVLPNLKYDSINAELCTISNKSISNSISNTITILYFIFQILL